MNHRLEEKNLDFVKSNTNFKTRNRMHNFRHAKKQNKKRVVDFSGFKYYC